MGLLEPKDSQIRKTWFLACNNLFLPGESLRLQRNQWDLKLSDSSPVRKASIIKHRLYSWWTDCGSWSTDCGSWSIILGKLKEWGWSSVHHVVSWGLTRALDDPKHPASTRRVLRHILVPVLIITIVTIFFLVSSPLCIQLLREVHVDRCRLFQKVHGTAVIMPCSVDVRVVSHLVLWMKWIYQTEVDEEFVLALRWEVVIWPPVARKILKLNENDKSFTCYILHVQKKLTSLRTSSRRLKAKYNMCCTKICIQPARTESFGYCSWGWR